MQPLVESRDRVLCRVNGLGQLSLGQPLGRADVLDSTGGDRADAVLRLQRVSDLADGESVERRVQDGGDLGRDLHTSARQADDDELSGGALGHISCHELASKQTPGFAAVAEA